MKDSWRKYLFKNVIKSTQLGTNLIGNEKNTGIPLLKMGNLTIGGFSFNKLEKIEYSKSYEAEKFILKKGDFLFNTRNTLELVGKSAVWNNNLSEAIFNSNIMRIKFEEDKADDFFLGYYFSQGKGWNEFKRISTGTTSVAAIYSRDLFECEIKIPPLPQQRKIAKILSTVDAVIEKTEAAIAKYQQLKQGLMQDLFTRGIDVRTGQLRPKQTEAPDLYQASELGWIPKEWEVEDFENSTEIITDFTANGSFESLRINVKYYYERNYGRLIRLTDLRQDLQSDGVYVDKEGFDYLSKSELKTNDIMLANVGEYTGFACLMPKVNYPATIAPNMFLVRTNKELFDSQFMYYYMTYPLFTKQVDNVSASSATKLLNKTNFRAMHIFKPSLDEQTLIAQKLQSIDQKIHTEQRALAKYQQLKAGLMQDLLTGEVSV